MATSSATTVAYPPVDGTQPCAAEDPELFFPVTSRDRYFSEPRATAVCTPCPFFRPCLEWALAYDTAGIWAGTNEDQRHDIRARRGIRPRRLTY